MGDTAFQLTLNIGIFELSSAYEIFIGLMILCDLMLRLEKQGLILREYVNVIMLKQNLIIDGIPGRCGC